jgi:hypothetical protein
LEKVGFKVDVVSSDWQTVVARRARKEAPDKGGWNIFYTTTVTVDADNVAGNAFTSGAWKPGCARCPGAERIGRQSGLRQGPRRSGSSATDVSMTTRVIVRVDILDAQWAGAGNLGHVVA